MAEVDYGNLARKVEMVSQYVEGNDEDHTTYHQSKGLRERLLDNYIDSDKPEGDILKRFDQLKEIAKSLAVDPEVIVSLQPSSNSDKKSSVAMENLRYDKATSAAQKKGYDEPYAVEKQYINSLLIEAALDIEIERDIESNKSSCLEVSAPQLYALEATSQQAALQI